jgi:hypothetical protein
MAKQGKRSTGWRIIAIVLFGLTTVVTLLSGLGTTCVAFAPNSWGESMARLASYQGWYIAFVVVGLACAGFGIWVFVELIRRRPHASLNALIVLLVGGAAAAVHMAISQSVRGSSAPINMRVYITALTLAFFLLLRLPALRKRAGLERESGAGGSGAAAGGAAFIVAGVVTLTTPLWVGATHIGPGGENWVGALWSLLQVGGWGMVVLGLGLTVWALAALPRAAFGRTGSIHGAKTG